MNSQKNIEIKISEYKNVDTILVANYLGFFLLLLHPYSCGSLATGSFLLKLLQASSRLSALGNISMLCRG
jgi:hypothetical protein